MSNHNPQFDDSTVRQPSNSGVSRDSRWMDAWRLCGLVLAVLILHWITTQCIVNWLGGEGALIRAQEVSPSTLLSDDGWRRTARGWEYKMNESEPRPTVLNAAPTKHISPYQFWPAAAAACMLLLISGLPDTKNAQRTSQLRQAAPSRSLAKRGLRPPPAALGEVSILSTAQC